MENTSLLLFATLALINSAAFIYVGVDKRRSINQSERIPEAHLFFVAMFFAALGVFLGIIYFRHKTKKIYFTLGIGLLFIKQAALLMFIYGRL